MVSITWIAARLFLKKAWVWFKNYWYVPAVLAYTVVLWVVFRRNGAATLKVLAASTKSYEDQLKALKETHTVEMEKRDKALKEYEDIVNALEQEYAERRETLSNNKKKKVKEYIKEFNDDPAGLAARLEEKFGIKYTPSEVSNE